MTATNTAILIFSLSDDEAVKNKSFYYKNNLSQILNANTLKTVKKTNVDFFHYTEKNQQGNTFGERFTNAIDAVFKKGYDNVIAIGNDTPKINTKHLTEAISILNTNGFALGPSTDGGFYLIALQKKHFDKAIFCDFNWKTNKITKEIKNYIKSKHITITTFNYLNDVDSFFDLKSVLKTLSSKFLALYLEIQKLIQIQSLVTHHINFSLFQIVTPKILNKGSPL